MSFVTTFNLYSTTWTTQIMIRITICWLYKCVSLNAKSLKQINSCLLPGVLALWWCHLSPKCSKMAASMTNIFSSNLSTVSGVMNLNCVYLRRLFHWTAQYQKKTYSSQLEAEWNTSLFGYEGVVLYAVHQRLFYWLINETLLLYLVACRQTLTIQLHNR